MREITDSSIVVPDGFKLYNENTSYLLLPSSNEAFLNPVQEFNRDISVACINVWSEELNRTKEARWKHNQEKKGGPNKKRLKTLPGASVESDSQTDQASNTGTAPSKSETAKSDIFSAADADDQGATRKNEYRPYKFTILEALSATGLRSIRYAKEIPLVKYVIANDLSESATTAMKRNVEINKLGPTDAVSSLEGSETSTSHKLTSKTDSALGKVRINEGDACTLMYSHREPRNRVDVVDLDPYGTAAPFIDAAVQCVNDDGLLCVTCTDLSVLASANYPEKCFSNYGGVSVKAEYCHEAALRLVLHTISTSASRYGRYIETLLSLSIDFYVRIFVRVRSAPIEVKRAAAKTSTYYVCTGCQSFYGQPFGKVFEKVHEPSGNVNSLFKSHAGPPVSQRCPECDSTLHMAGPMWSGPLHDSGFVTKVLDHLQENESKYGTTPRMKGMLTVAKDELDTPFFFTPSKIAGFFHCTCPSLDDVASALLHAGHQISRSHACPGSLKTSASREHIHDIFRSWVKLHPVKMENIAENSPAKRLLAKEPSTMANFKRHPQSFSASSQVKLVRYQQNPTVNWGPGTKADSGKRKRAKDDE